MNFSNMGPEHNLFKKAKSMNPDLTEDEFLQKRNDALSRANAGEHAFAEAGGILMEGAPTAEELKEISEDERDMSRGGSK